MKMDAPEPKYSDGFTASALQGVLPLVIWAAHFFLSYASAEVASALDLQRFTVGGVPAPTIWLGIITVAAIAVLCVLTVVAIRHGKADAESGNTRATIRIGAAILALVGVLWSAVAIGFADGIERGSLPSSTSSFRTLPHVTAGVSQALGDDRIAATVLLRAAPITTAICVVR